jgi:hypothetical protein
MSFFSKLFGLHKSELDESKSSKSKPTLHEDGSPNPNGPNASPSLDKSSFLQSESYGSSTSQSSVAPKDIQESPYVKYQKDFDENTITAEYDKPIDAKPDGIKRLKINERYQGFPVTKVKFFSFSDAEEIILPKTIRVIDESTFYSCEKLKLIEIPSGVLALPKDAFNGDLNLVSVNLSEGLETIGETCFKDCASLTSLSLPSSLKSIDPTAFDGADKLATISFPSGNRWFFVNNGLLFNGTKKKLIAAFCHSLSDVNLAGTLEIGPYALSHLSLVKELIVPEGVAQIDDWAFEDDASLRRLVLPSTLRSIGKHVFDGCKSLDEIVLSPDNASFVFDNGVLYDAKKTRAIIAIKKFVGVYRSPASLISVDPSAFADCFFLVSVNLNEGLTEIGKHSFFGERKMKIVSAVLPKSLTDIGEAVFPTCLQEAFYQGTPMTWERISGLKIDDNRSLRKSVLFYGEQGPADKKNRWWHFGEDKMTPIVWGKDVKATMDAKETSVDPTVLGSIGCQYQLLDDGTGYVFSGIRNGDITNNIYLPQTYRGLSVKVVGEEAFKEIPDDIVLQRKSRHVRQVFLPEGLLEIRHAAFRNCSFLRGVVLPSTLVQVDKSLFSNCKELRWVTFPARLDCLPNANFTDCTKLERVFYWGSPRDAKTLRINPFNEPFGKAKLSFYSEKRNLNTNFSWWHFGKDGKPEIWNDASWTWRDLQTADLDSLGSYDRYFEPVVRPAKPMASTLPPAKKKSDVSNLTSKGDVTSSVSTEYVSSPVPTVKPIKTAMEENNEKKYETERSNLNSVSSPSKLGNLPVAPDCDFEYCDQLVSSPDGSVIKDSQRCTITRYNGTLTSFILPSTHEGKTITQIHRFETPKVSSVELLIPKGYQTIEGHAFEGNCQVKIIHFATLPRLWDNEEFRHTNIQEVSFADDAVEIPKFYFDSASELRRAFGGSSIQKVGEMAFARCQLLEEVGPFSSLEEIDTGGFFGCSALKQFFFPETLKSIKALAFSGTSLQSIRIPSQCVNIEQDAFIHCPFSHFEVDLGNPVFSSREDCLCTGKGRILLQAPSKTISKFEVPEGVAELADHSFAYANYQEILLPPTLEKIDHSVFSKCPQLTEIRIPKSVDHISAGAFDDCSELKAVFFEEPASVKAFFGHTFSNCRNLTWFVFPSSVTKISRLVFGGCPRLTLVILPPHLEEIDLGFAGGIGETHIKTFFYPGTQTEFASVKISEPVSDSLLKMVAFFSEIKPTSKGKYWHFMEDGSTPVLW